MKTYALAGLVRLAGIIPLRAGRALVDLMTRAIMLRQPRMYHAAAANLRHILGPGVSEADLRHALYQLFSLVVRSYYELFHNLGQGKTEIAKFNPPVLLKPETKRYLHEALASGRGLFILACHTANFDLGGLALSQHLPVTLQVLSQANPPADYQFFNHLRAQCGALMTPISPEALRDAVRRLQAGGAVITGVDHPVKDGSDAPVTFFGATAYLPTGYVRIPLLTDCLVMTVSVLYDKDVYWLVANPPLEMVRTGQRQRDQEVNLQRILAQMEAFIRAHPEQWRTFDPVWECTFPSEMDELCHI